MISIIKIKHNGMPFIDSACARLLATGIEHHYIVLFD